MIAIDTDFEIGYKLAKGKTSVIWVGEGPLGPRGPRGPSPTQITDVLPLASL